jgi:hypothetical protein
VVDLNLDGMLDLVQVNRESNIGLWRNVGWGTADDPEPMGSWIALRLVGTGGNTDAVGSWVEVRTAGHTQEREVTIGGGHASGEHGWMHFGIGARDNADIRVTWPDGTTSGWMTVDANQRVVIARDAEHPQIVEPR